MGRYALSWYQRNEVGELELRQHELTVEAARRLIESKDDYVVAVAKMIAEKLEGANGD